MVSARVVAGVAWICANLLPLSVSAAVEVTSFELGVSDLRASVTFYTDVLQFELLSQDEKDHRPRANLRLGGERIVLRQPIIGRTDTLRSLPANDRSFQHLAIVVSDIDLAYAQLQRHQVQIVSAGVQTLPDWNYDAAGIRALYFRDPDGHFLELIQFPPNKGEPRWHRGVGGLFLGIDHSAFVVRAIKSSIEFYRDQLGFSLMGESFNYGGEQERLNRVPGSRVRIASLRGARGPGLELLQFQEPGETGEIRSNDWSGWLIHLQTTTSTLIGEGRDPDGHALRIGSNTAGPGELAFAALRQHWTRYLMEGAELGIFMIVALWLALALEHPRSRLHKGMPSPLGRRLLFGIGIGVTVVLLIYSDWGRQSGAQFNPAVTLALLYLHRIQPWDASFYIIAQFLGGLLGLLIGAAPFWKLSKDPAVNFVVTKPGKPGAAIAFVAEFLISFILLATLRLVYHSDLLKPAVGYFAGALLCLYITFESPYSGMSLNPARTFASALPSGNWKAIWIYFTAPILAMLLAAILVG